MGFLNFFNSRTPTDKATDSFLVKPPSEKLWVVRYDLVKNCTTVYTVAGEMIVMRVKPVINPISFYTLLL